MNWKLFLQQLSVLVFALFLWEGIVFFTGVPRIVFPSPGIVALEFFKLAQSTLIQHTLVTLSEAVSGFIAGSVLGFLLGVVVAKSKKLEGILSPYIVAVQSVPIISLAPLILLWFGFGFTSKVIMCALIVFFPLFVNTVTGLKMVDENQRQLFKSLRANELQVFLKLELPSIFPVLFAGLKTAITLSVIGAVVSEFVGAREGLGYAIIYHSNMANTPAVFAYLIQLSLLGIILYAVISLLEKTLIPWNAKAGN